MKPTWNNFTCRTYKKAGDPQAGTEPASELLRLFIQKIVVHEKNTKWSKKAMQTIEIYYTDIGCVGEGGPQDKESPRQEISA